MTRSVRVLLAAVLVSVAGGACQPITAPDPVNTDTWMGSGLLSPAGEPVANDTWMGSGE